MKRTFRQSEVDASAIRTTRAYFGWTLCDGTNTFSACHECWCDLVRLDGPGGTAGARGARGIEMTERSGWQA